MRQAPDVIFVGEIRDYDTAFTALQACETGHLVLASMHSATVADTMERFVNSSRRIRSASACICSPTSSSACCARSWCRM
jgi:Tfp pilus assembly pilus retraction ATPase PilT